jgi:two-component system sensor histidine kinase TctE
MERQIDLAFESVEIMATVRGSERLLHELFSNLLDNAIRYTPVGGHITIRMRRGINLIVEIEDSGVGIDPLERDKVFDRFYRVLGTGVDGSGLGLSIVKEIATLHHAQVTLHTGTQGLGTLVKVIFDLRRDFVASVTK